MRLKKEVPELNQDAVSFEIVTLWSIRASPYHGTTDSDHQIGTGCNKKHLAQIYKQYFANMNNWSA